MTEIILPPETEFLFKHGKNTSERMAPDLLTEIMKLLDGKEITYNSRQVRLKVLTKEPKHRDDDGWYIMFDALNPDDTYDHIEFFLKCSGWGRGT